MSSSAAAVLELANQWLQLDPDPETRAEIKGLVDRNAHEELQSRLRPYIAFGTAGLRAQMEAGFARLNSLTIIQASQGLAEYVLRTQGPRRAAVIGRDARHNSEKFARLTAAVFAEKGFEVHYYPVPTHTPLVPYGVKFLGAAVGVMITASHNPAQDNGYKVYWTNSCQIIPPHDNGIAKSISQNLQPSKDYMAYVNGTVPLDSTTWNTSSLTSVRNGYFHQLSLTVSCPPQILPFIYTPMHGVGLPYMNEAVGASQNMIVVRAQAEPDADFPTVRFPNPEEVGALDLAMETANDNSAQLIVATDPDADRLAVAERFAGTWHQFTGNQLGVLLASYLLSEYQEQQKPNNDLSRLCMLATTVSSQMLAHIASVEGFRFDETLTGFKWLGNRALDLAEEGFNVRFAFEQAIGYMIPGVVHDKDGIAAASLFLAARAAWHAEGRTPWQQLQALYAKYGYFADIDTYVRSPSAAATSAAFARIRALGSPYPVRFQAGQKIQSWRDLTYGYDSKTEGNVPALPVDPATEMLTVEVEGDVRFTIRGSGTEPKIKLYVEGRGISFEEARQKADCVLSIVLDEWLPGFQRG